jgi:hypothetical protein
LAAWTTCRGGGAAPDGGVDAAQADATPSSCDPVFGRSYVVTLLEVMGENEGRDFDGDGVPDNAVAFLAGIANPGLQSAIEWGDGIFVFDIVGWTDPPTPDAGPVSLDFYQAIDADLPPDPGNNLGGAGQFLTRLVDYTLECQPRGRFEHAEIVGHELRARANTWAFASPNTGTMSVSDVEITITFNEDFSTAEGVLSGLAPLCALTRSYLPGSQTGNVLELVVNGYGVNPDVDVDHDGLETVVGDGHGGIKECIDGALAEPPAARVTGNACACDPRLADGYSMAFRGTMVRAALVGIAENGS